MKANSKWKALCPQFIPAFAMFYLCKTTINAIKLASTLVVLSPTNDKRNTSELHTKQMNDTIQVFWKHPVSLVLDKEYIMQFKIQ